MYEKLLLAIKAGSCARVQQLLPHMTKELINQYDDHGETALHCAAYYGDQRIMHVLMNYGADPLKKSEAGRSVEDVFKQSTAYILRRLRIDHRP